MNIKEEAKAVKLASPKMAGTSEEARNKALLEVVKQLKARQQEIFEANAMDLKQAEIDKVAAPIIKRLKFDETKLRDVIAGIEDLVKLEDPLFKQDMHRQLDEGLTLYRETCPIGVIGVIFEARPDALIQISSLCIKSGNCVILKGGSETMNSNRVLFNIIYEAVIKSGMPENCMLQLEARSEITDLLTCNESVDLLIPRGSNAFVQYIMNNTKIPVMGHADGICHIYVDKEADFKKAIPIIIDAKTQYVSACNSVETLLIHKDIVDEFVPKLYEALKENNLEENIDNLLIGNYDTRIAYEETKKYLKENPDITAIFAISDFMATGVAKAICDLGLKIGKDISVVGFDGMDISEFYNPGITTVKQPKREIALKSIELLFDLLKGECENKHLVLETELIERESCGNIIK